LGKFVASLTAFILLLLYAADNPFMTKSKRKFILNFQNIYNTFNTWHSCSSVVYTRAPAHAYIVEVELSEYSVSQNIIITSHTTQSIICQIYFKGSQKPVEAF